MCNHVHPWEDNHQVGLIFPPCPHFTVVSYCTFSQNISPVTQTGFYAAALVYVWIYSHLAELSHGSHEAKMTSWPGTPVTPTALILCASSISLSHLRVPTVSNTADYTRQLHHTYRHLLSSTAWVTCYMDCCCFGCFSFFFISFMFFNKTYNALRMNCKDLNLIMHNQGHIRLIYIIFMYMSLLLSEGFSRRSFSLCWVPSVAIFPPFDSR